MRVTIAVDTTKKEKELSEIATVNRYVVLVYFLPIIVFFMNLIVFSSGGPISDIIMFILMGSLMVYPAHTIWKLSYDMEENKLELM